MNDLIQLWLSKSAEEKENKKPKEVDPLVAGAIAAGSIPAFVGTNIVSSVPAIKEIRKGQRKRNKYLSTKKDFRDIRDQIGLTDKDVYHRMGLFGENYAGVRPSLADHFRPMEKIRDRHNQGKYKVEVRTSGGSPGITAHELGHAKNMKHGWFGKRFFKSPTDFVRMAQGGSMLSLPVGLAAPGIMAGTENETVENIAAGVPLALSAPLLAEETIASGKGAVALNKVLKNRGMGAVPRWKESLKAFSGLPTYYAASSLPLLALMGDRLYGRSKKEKE